MDRKNVSVREKTMVTKILFQGLRATGVEYVHKGQKKKVNLWQENKNIGVVYSAEVV